MRELLQQYDGDSSPHWQYTQLFLAFRDKGRDAPETQALLGDALSVNPHVPRLLRRPRLPAPPQSPFIEAGGADEALEYLESCGTPWFQTQGAIAWLVERAAELSAAPKSLQKRGRKTSARYQ